MKFYSTWQEALVEFIHLYGHNYQDSYNLVSEFEIHLERNRKGAYYIRNI